MESIAQYQISDRGPMDSYLAHGENVNPTATHEHKDLRPDAARTRLRECKDPRHACEVIREIVSNLLGCEEMALFQVHGKHARLSLVWSFGIEPTALCLPECLNDSSFSGVLAGHAYIDEGFRGANGIGRHGKASAFVPIRFNGRTAGVLVLLRLLPQKTRIDALDRGLLAVLSREAGKPLFGGRAGGPDRRGKNR